jgi:hypothetical protein
MSLRAQLESFPASAQLMLFTTLGHVYVGTLTDIQDDSIQLTRPDGTTTIALNLNDISGVRALIEEAEERA